MFQTLTSTCADLLVRRIQYALLASVLMLGGCMGKEDSINEPVTGGGGSSVGGDTGGSTGGDPVDPGTGASAEKLMAGHDEYVLKCASCHDDENSVDVDGNGSGAAQGAPIFYQAGVTEVALATIIEATMPPASLSEYSCDAECASSTAAFILNGYSIEVGGSSGEVDLDADGDGILIPVDECPNEVGAPDSANGCPWPDQDNDGIADRYDVCPLEFGTRADGCPLDEVIFDLVNGESEYEAQCSGCHDSGDTKGQATLFGETSDIFGSDGAFKCEIVDNCYSTESLTSYIAEFMPTTDPDSCNGVCATDVAGYLIKVLANDPSVPVEPQDSDNDGVIDSEDECPTKFGTLPNGCPVEVEEPPVEEPNGVTLPGVIQAEDYIRFNDLTNGNSGITYRTDSVEIVGAGNGGYGVGWTEAGEWLEFDISLENNASFEVDAVVSSEPGGGEFSLEVDGAAVGPVFSIGRTGGWDTWMTVTEKIGVLGKGNHVLRVSISRGSFNLDSLNFKIDGDVQENTDSDNDGVNDDVDECPNVPGGANGIDGCPDADGDGIADKDDNCPNEAGISSLQGCPEGTDPNIEYSLADGEAEYNFRCQSCHDDENAAVRGTGTFGTPISAIVGSDGFFECTLTDCSDLTVLTEYIKEEMPVFATEECGDFEQCAANTAYYIIETFGKGDVPVIADQDGDGVADEDDNCPTVAGSASNNGCPIDSTDGAALYIEKGCANCHGAEGEGVEGRSEIVLANWNQDSLTDIIHTTMPKGASASCEDDCASAIATWLLSLAPEVSCDGNPELLPRRLRLLTPTEYKNTVVDLFGLDSNTTVAEGLPITEAVRGFDNNSEASSVSTSHMDRYWSASLAISTDVSLNGLLNCGGLAADQCADTFVSDFGKSAFRRPLTDTEKDDYVDLFLSGTDNEEGARYVIRGMLVSPHFLYRSEIGSASEGDYELTPYETASLLSYTFWGSTPDAALMTAADNGALSTSAQLRAQVTRLLADDRAKEQLTHFAKQWLDLDDFAALDKSDSEYPEFSSELGIAMETELKMFMSEVFLGGESSFSDLYLADYTFVNQLLAEFYGINGVSSSAFQKVDAPLARGGMLSLGGLLASHGKRDQSSPIKRGVMVRERLLCQEFGTPPINVGEIESLDPTKSTRERFTAHTDNPGCSTCHSRIDPVGFSFERFDGIGQYRETEGNNVAVDDSGYVEGLVGLFDSDRTDYFGTNGLSEILASADNVAECFVDHFQSYSKGVAHPDSCEVESVTSSWKASSYSFSDLWLESVSTDTFLKRQ